MFVVGVISYFIRHCLDKFIAIGLLHCFGKMHGIGIGQRGCICKGVEIVERVIAQHAFAEVTEVRSGQVGTVFGVYRAKRFGRV
jgi:hypothetical protein